jgi:hypothetical protein
MDDKPPKIDLGFLRPLKPGVPCRIVRSPRAPHAVAVVPIKPKPGK